MFTPPAPPPLTSGQVQRAEALAHFSVALMGEWDRDVDGALTNYLQAARLDPDNESLHFRAAMGLLQAGRPAEALAVMQDLCRRRPKSEKAWLWLGLTQRALENEKGATAAYRKAIEVAPTASAAYLELAGLELRAGREAEAVRTLEQSLARVKDNGNVLRALGELYVRAATRLTDKGARSAQLARALSIFEKALAQTPDDEALLYQLGDLEVLNGDFAKAIQYFEKIEKKNPDDLRVKQKLALSLVAQGDKAKAIEALESVARQQPTNGRVFFYLGELYEQTGETDKALLNFGLAARLSPQEPSAVLKQAILQSGKKNYAAALAVLDEGMKAMPAEARLTEMSAYVRMAQHDYHAALPWFEKTRDLMAASTTTPMAQGFHLNFAVAAALEGHFEASADQLATALDLQQDYLGGFAQQVLQEGGTNGIAAGVRVLQILTGRRPENAQLFVYLGLLQNFATHHAEAIATFEHVDRMVDEKPALAEELPVSFYFWYGSACERTKQFARAEKLFLTCVEREPRHAEAHNYLAYMWAERGEKLDQAMEHVDAALKLNPKSPAYLDTRGWILYQRGLFKEARAEIEKAMGLLADDPTITEHMGDVLDKLGEPEQALTFWKKAVAVGSDSEQLLKRLRDLGLDVDALEVEGKAYREKKRAQEPDAEDEESEPEAPLP